MNTFEQWMEAVDRICDSEMGGLTTSDLPDFLWRDEYDSGRSPQEAWDAFCVAHADEMQDCFDW
jgi:hypothetical protein